MCVVCDFHEGYIVSMAAAGGVVVLAFLNSLALSRIYTYIYMQGVCS